MPGRYSGRRRYGPRPIINSEKHQHDFSDTTGTSVATEIFAKAVTAPSNTVAIECHRGGHIKAVWVSLDFCGLAATGVLQNTLVYMMKNPGNNLTPPGTGAYGTSNEKKFIFKTWTAMTMRNQDGNPPYHWEGWVKVPKPYQRMGTDDVLSLTYGTTTVTGHIFANFIYKERF